MVQNHQESRSSSPGLRQIKSDQGVGRVHKGSSVLLLTLLEPESGEILLCVNPVFFYVWLGLGRLQKIQGTSSCGWPTRCLVPKGLGVCTQGSEKRVPGTATWLGHRPMHSGAPGYPATLRVDRWKHQKPSREQKKKHLELAKEKNTCSAVAWLQSYNLPQNQKEKHFLFQCPSSSHYCQSLTSANKQTNKQKIIKWPRSIFAEVAIKGTFGDVRQ